MKTHTILFTAIAFALTIGCGGSDDDNGGPNGDSAGDASFEISGDVEGEKSGLAAFLPDDEHDILQLAIHDHDPQTYSLTLIRQGEGAEIPPVGEYTIGGPVGADFHAVYTDVENDAVEYSEFGDEAGILEITESSDTSASGVFEMVLPRIEDAGQSFEGQQIVITDGEFTAPVR